jgi:AGZA family xanthine/uracil permease-like MFS transporter
MREWLERYFEFAALGTNWRTEILAGVTTFVTMAYIIFVNPSILQETGMPFQAVMAATCVSAAIGSLVMGIFARYPIALAPGMGLNAYFTYSVVKGLGVPWTVALGAVFLSGVIFLILTIFGIRQLIVSAIPPELYAAVASGIGLFIAVIGLRNSGVVVASPATLVTLGDLREPNTLLALFGFFFNGRIVIQKRSWRDAGWHSEYDCSRRAAGTCLVAAEHIQTRGLQRNGVPAGYIGRNKSWHTRDRVRFSFCRSV